MPHICVRESGQHWFSWWLAAYSASSHCLNQRWFIVNWNLRNKLQWNFNENTKRFIREHVSENIVCEITDFFAGGYELRHWYKDKSVQDSLCNCMPLLSGIIHTDLKSWLACDITYILEYPGRRRLMRSHMIKIMIRYQCYICILAFGIQSPRLPESLCLLVSVDFRAFISRVLYMYAHLWCGLRTHT